MGNSGSVHNLHIDGVRSELNSYYQPQQQLHLYRTSKKKIQLQQQHVAAAGRHQYKQDMTAAAWTNSLPHMSVVTPTATGGDGPQTTQQFKVLPQLNDNLKLRVTTNGAILLSGGTISGRKEPKCIAAELPPLVGKEQQRQHKLLPIAMQRAHTFIYESPADESRHQRPEAAAPPLFRRARTLLNVHYSSDDAVEGGIKKYAAVDASEFSKPAVAASTKKSSKINKYNKKRKAPLAPVPLAEANAPIIKVEKSKSMLSTREPEVAAKVCAPAAEQNATLARARFFRTNIKSSTLAQNQQQLQSQQVAKQQQSPLERGNQLRNSFSSISHHSHNKTQSRALLVANLLSYRREKSSDAILFRAQQQNQLQPLPSQAASERRLDDGQQQQHLTAAENQTQPKARLNVLGDSSSINIGCRTETSAATAAATSAASRKQQATKIPQIKRTFYFGMNNAINAKAAAITQTESRKKTEDVNAAAVGRDQADTILFYDQQLVFESCTQLCHHDLEAKRDEMDNGLLVHVRPTLPRRQLETPSFSPAAAWLRLVEEQQFLQRAHKIKEQQQQHENDATANGTPYATKSSKIMMPPSLIVSDHNGEDSNFAANNVTAALKFSLNSPNNNNTAMTTTIVKETPIQLRTTPIMNAKKSQEIINSTDATTTLTQALATKTYNASEAAAAWTPQQDLGEDEGDEDDDDVEETASQDHNESSSDEYCSVKDDRRYNNRSSSRAVACYQKNRNNKSKNLPVQFGVGGASTVHVFSLSLPRDVHIQAHAQHKTNSHNDKVTSGFSSLQKLKCSVDKETRLQPNEYSHGDVVDGNANKKATVNGVDNDATTTTHCTTNNRSDNWVLHKTRDASTGFGAFTSQSSKALNTHWNTMTDIMEPISLSYLTGGKHVMYLPGQHKATAENKSTGASEALTPTMTTTMHKQNAVIEGRNLSASTQQKRQRKRVMRENLQDDPTKMPTLLSIGSPKYSMGVTPKIMSPGAIASARAPLATRLTSIVKYRAPLGGAATSTPAASVGTAATGYEKPTRFSFQSTVRLLEKRRLAIKLSRDAEFKEAQRKSELEAMKRVEEDFQRKRALEKANIRQQMHLFRSESSDGGGGGGINELYASLPAVITSQKQDQYPNDTNNNFNIYYRAEPDGAVSSPSSTFPLQEKFFKERLLFHRKSSRTKGFYDCSDCGESDIEAEMANLMRTTSLVEPYLQSIVK